MKDNSKQSNLPARTEKLDKILEDLFKGIRQLLRQPGFQKTRFQKGRVKKWSLHSLLLFPLKCLLILTPCRANILRRQHKADALGNTQQPRGDSASRTKVGVPGPPERSLVNTVGFLLYFLDAQSWLSRSPPFLVCTHRLSYFLLNWISFFIWCKIDVNFIFL